MVKSELRSCTECPRFFIVFFLYINKNPYICVYVYAIDFSLTKSLTSSVCIIGKKNFIESLRILLKRN